MIYVGGLDSVELDFWTAFVDCRGNRWRWKNGPPFEYHHDLCRNESYTWVPCNRLCKTHGKEVGVRTARFGDEFEEVFEQCVVRLGKRTNVHCMQGASRSHFFSACLLVGGQEPGRHISNEVTAEMACKYLQKVRAIADHTGFSSDHMGTMEAVKYYSEVCRKVCEKHQITIKPLEVVQHDELMKRWHGIYARCLFHLQRFGRPLAVLGDAVPASAVASAVAVLGDAVPASAVASPVEEESDSEMEVRVMKLARLNSCLTEKLAREAELKKHVEGEAQALKEKVVELEAQLAQRALVDIPVLPPSPEPIHHIIQDWTELHEAFNSSQHQNVATCLASAVVSTMVLSVGPSDHKCCGSTVFHIAAFRSPFITKGTSTNEQNIFNVNWLAGWVAGWLGGWVGGWLGNWVGGWVAGWLGGSVAGWLGRSLRQLFRHLLRQLFRHLLRQVVSAVVSAFASAVCFGSLKARCFATTNYCYC